MVVQVTGHKYAHCRRQRTIGVASVIDVCNEFSRWRADLTGDLPKPKIKRVFKAQGCSSAVNSYFSWLYPFACHLGLLRFLIKLPFTPLRRAAERGPEKLYTSLLRVI